jgi:hypothetical protein
MLAKLPFQGGMWDRTDGDLLYTALRETAGRNWSGTSIW